jgi:AcrR family transcriptional regulator
MTDQMSKRRYEMKARAAQQDETRRRITESAVELHGTVGPSKTSFSALAEHAGVRRSTLYRHFPDEASLFAACNAHWLAANPPPDVDGWRSVKEPDARLRTALRELYAFYRRTEPMLANLLRDEPVMPVVAELFAPFHAYLAHARDTLMAGRAGRGRARGRTQAAVGHALAFTTWRSLTREQGLRDADAVEMMCGLVAKR